MIVSMLALGFGLAAVCNLTMIGAGLAVAKGQPTPVRPLGALYAFIVAGATLTISGGGVAGPRFTPLIEGTEFLLTLVAGPVFYLLIAALAGRPARMIAVCAPALVLGVAFSIAAAVAGGAPDIRPAVLTQMGYSAAAGVMIFSRPAKSGGPRLAQILVIVIIAMHLVQAARMTAPHVQALAPAVPIVISLIAFGAVFAAIAALAMRVKAERRAPADARSIGDLQALMTADGAYLNPDYRLADLAAAAQCSAGEISRTINERTGAGFVHILNNERLRHATELLTSPQEARTSIEAIALMSGFRSRSAFYRAFTETHGVTPAAYRKAQMLS